MVKTTRVNEDYYGRLTAHNDSNETVDETRMTRGPHPSNDAGLLGETAKIVVADRRGRDPQR